MRTSHFNASMAPNGVMEIWSGLLLRTRNEAQLAAVLGHEYTHYEKRHTLKLFREVRSKSASAAWLAFTGIGLLASFGLLADIFHYSREMEHEADIGGLDKMAAAGYDTREAAKIWEQLRDEMDATAAARQVKSRKDKDDGMFADHPPSAERVVYLTHAALSQPGVAGATGADAYVRTMGNYLPAFIDDQLKQNDFGASEYLVSALGRQGWTDWLHYAQGELFRRRGAEGDLAKAVDFYGTGIAEGGAMADLWRGRGLALLKLGRADEAKADLKEYLKRAPNASDRAMIAMMAGG
jgi:predicted Zn-dependent protease